MLQQISYQQYYNSLTCDEWRKLNELHAINHRQKLPIPALHIVQLERHGYWVDLDTGEVKLNTGEKVLDCGHARGFYALLDATIKSQCGVVDVVGDGGGEASGVSDS